MEAMTSPTVVLEYSGVTFDFRLNFLKAKFRPLRPQEEVLERPVC